MLTNPLVWAALLLGVLAGYFIRQFSAQRQADSAEQKIKNWLEEAKTQAKELVLDAKERASKLLEEVKTEEKARKVQLDKLEERLLKKEEGMEKQLADLASQKSSLEEESKKLNAAKGEADELRGKIMKELEKVANLTFEDAKKQILEKVKDESRND